MKRLLVFALRFALGGAALWAVTRELHNVDRAGLALELGSLRPSQYALGAGLTVASFLLLGIIEWMALRHPEGTAGERVPLRAALRTGFVANALSQSVGLAIVTGAAVRMRAYARYGLRSADIVQTTAFVTITATLGLLAAGAVAVFTNGAPVPVGALSLAPLPTALALGGIVAAYVMWSFAGTKDAIGWRTWRIPRPTPALAVGQATISTLDWILTGAVLYAFMPQHFGLRIGIVLGAYLVAQVLAVTSHVPAGAGIFELVVLAILLRVDPAAPRAAVAAALVMFRVVYYLVPLCVAAVVATVGEVSRRGHVRAGTYERIVKPSAVLGHGR